MNPSPGLLSYPCFHRSTTEESLACHLFRQVPHRMWPSPFNGPDPLPTGSPAGTLTSLSVSAARDVLLLRGERNDVVRELWTRLGSRVDTTIAQTMGRPRSAVEWEMWDRGTPGGDVRRRLGDGRRRASTSEKIPDYGRVMRFAEAVTNVHRRSVGTSKCPHSGSPRGLHRRRTHT